MADKYGEKVVFTSSLESKSHVVVPTLFSRISRSRSTADPPNPAQITQSITTYQKTRKIKNNTNNTNKNKNGCPLSTTMRFRWLEQSAARRHLSSNDDCFFFGTASKLISFRDHFPPVFSFNSFCTPCIVV